MFLFDLWNVRNDLLFESTIPVAIGEDLATDVLGNHSSALQVHEHTADGRLLGAFQLLLTHLACYRLQAPLS